MRLFYPPLLLSGLWLSLTLSAAGNEPSSQGLEPALSWPERMRQRVFRDQLDAAWLADGRTLWYRVQTGAKTQAFVKVDEKGNELNSYVAYEEPSFDSVSAALLR